MGKFVGGLIGTLVAGAIALGVVQGMATAQTAAADTVVHHIRDCADGLAFDQKTSTCTYAGLIH